MTDIILKKRTLEARAAYLEGYSAGARDAAKEPASCHPGTANGAPWSSTALCPTCRKAYLAGKAAAGK